MREIIVSLLFLCLGIFLATFSGALGILCALALA